jgi:hypothetical protein
MSPVYAYGYFGQSPVYAYGYFGQSPVYAYGYFGQSSLSFLVISIYLNYYLYWRKPDEAR